MASVDVYLGGQVLFRKDSGSATAHFYASDLSDNVRVVLSYSGSVTVEGKFRYKPFGQMATPLVSPTTLNPSHRFSNLPTTSTTGLYVMGARHYAPDLGRFLSRDPIGAHDYVFADANPVTFSDPSGLFSWRKDRALEGGGARMGSGGGRFESFGNAAYEVSYNLGTWEECGFVAATTTTEPPGMVEYSYPSEPGVTPTAAGQGTSEAGVAKGGLSPHLIENEATPEFNDFLESTGSTVGGRRAVRTNLGNRIYDATASGGDYEGLHEYKAGNTRMYMSQRLLEQMDKDVLVMQQSEVQVYWDLMRPTSQTVISALLDRGIVPVIWVG